MNAREVWEGRMKRKKTKRRLKRLRIQVEIMELEELLHNHGKKAGFRRKGAQHDAH